MTAVMLRPLAVAGSRNSDGTPNASGLVYLYSPGTTALMAGYMDEALSQAWPVTNGAIVLDAGGRALIWVPGPVDVIIQGPTGNPVSTFLGFVDTPANTVTVQNAGYTGTITDPVTGLQTQGAGGVTNQDAILTRQAASVGGPDGQYQESAGATPRTLQSVIRSIQVTPQDFGAVGNGFADDSAAMAAAIAEVTRLGGGTLYIPPGTYKITTAPQVGTISSPASGVKIIGGGSGCTNFQGFLSAYASAFRIEGLSIGGIDIESCNGVIVQDITVPSALVNQNFGIKVSGSTRVSLRDCFITMPDGNANASALNLSGHGVHVSRTTVSGGSTGWGIVFQYPGASSDTLIESVTFGGTGVSGIAFFPNVNGVSVIGCPTLGALTNPFAAIGATVEGQSCVWPGDIVNLGNKVTGSTQNVLSGGNVTIDNSKGDYFHVIGTTTGSAYNVTGPGWIPTTRGRELVIEFGNAAGGAVTGWTMNAAYVLASAVPTTDATSTIIRFVYDLESSKWREMSRATSTT